MICCISHTDTRLVWTQNPHRIHIFRAVACFLASHKGLTRHHRGTLYPIICPLLPQRFTGTYMLCCKVLSRTSTLHRTVCYICAVTYAQSHSAGRRDRRGRQAVCIFSPSRCTSASSLMVYRYEQSMYSTYSTYSTRANVYNAPLYRVGTEPSIYLNIFVIAMTRMVDDSGDGKTCLLSTNEAALGPVECSSVFCLSSIRSFPSNDTRPGNPNAGWKDVTLSYHSYPLVA